MQRSNFAEVDLPDRYLGQAVAIRTHMAFDYVLTKPLDIDKPALLVNAA